MVYTHIIHHSNTYLGYHRMVIRLHQLYQSPVPLLSGSVSVPYVLSLLLLFPYSYSSIPSSTPIQLYQSYCIPVPTLLLLYLHSLLPPFFIFDLHCILLLISYLFCIHVVIADVYHTKIRLALMCHIPNLVLLLGMCPLLSHSSFQLINLMYLSTLELKNLST